MRLFDKHPFRTMQAETGAVCRPWITKFILGCLKFFLGILISCLIFAAIFIILELHYRAEDRKQLPFPVRGLYEPDQHTYFRLRAGIWDKEFWVLDKTSFRVSTTEDHLRGGPYSLSKKAGAVRVLALGSSFTFGWGVDDDKTWPAQLQDLLNKENIFPGGAEVINGGLPGTHGDILIRQYLIRGRKYHPDVVVVDTQPETPFGDISDLDNPVWFKPDPDFLKKSIYYVDEEGILRTFITQDPFWQELTRKSFLIKHILMGMKTKSANDSLRKYWEDLKAQRDESLKPILELKRILDKEGIPIIVMVRHWASQFTDPPTPQDILTEKLNARGIPTVNLRPLFEPFENEHRYLVMDGHWNVAGNKLAAEQALRLLKENREKVLKKAGLYSAVQSGA